MTTSKRREVNPETVRYYRKQLGITQEELAERSTLGRKTIQRYESKGERQTPNATSLNKLSEALQVRPEDLMKPPPKKGIEHLLNRVPLKTSIAGSARTALTFMKLRYGLREETIIDLAPLAFLILAERSLQTRKAALDETVQALEAATGDAYRRLPYLRGAFHDGYDYGWIATERKSLDERKVYEQYPDYEGEEMSPFVDFLANELKEIKEKKLIEIKEESKEPDPLLVHAIELRSGYRDAPDYTIPMDSLAQDLGLDANDEADQHVLELIQEGSIDLWQAWEKKKEATEEAYLAWLEEQRQEIKRRRSEFFSSLKLDLDLGFTPNTSEGATPEREDQA